ncbi:MAG: NTP transferase domain-containing protein [Alphaproteobacteria bacterium]|nr:NTP transferase domain-containing protein [Alphaproteobacteria bacterium]
MKPPRVVAVIQARMGSTRLPGKVLKPIAGKPLLWHIVHRLQKSRLIQAIVVATSTNPRDDAIVEFGRDNDVLVVRGPEEDVLARFARAAEITDADIIVRVSSDAPFLDAEFIDHLVDALIEQQGDYVLLEENAETAHEGVDPFTRRGLDKLMMDAAHDPVAREHVTGYFKLHPDFVRIARAKPFPRLARAAGRLTIDTPDDLAFVEAVHARLEAKAGEASLGDLLLLLEREPSLRDLNGHVRQKEIAPQGGLALIRCDGGGAYGFGHVKRMIALARALRDSEGIGVEFAVNGGEEALTPILQAGFAATLVPSPRWNLGSVVADPDIFILDCRDGPTRCEVERFAARVPVTAVIDDGSERRLAADLAYYPPVPQVEDLDWTGSHCSVRTGWEWTLLGLAHASPRPRAVSARPTLLVTMGGSDPYGFTLKAAHALTALEPLFRARFVIGPGFAHKEQVAKAIVGLKSNFETIEGADGLATEYAACDLALASFGVTAYELAAYGVPALYLCATDDHARSASAFEHAGLGLSLGLGGRVCDRTIADAVLSLLSDGRRRRDMRAAGLMTVDGNGAARIARDLAAALSARRAGAKAMANWR